MWHAWERGEKCREFWWEIPKEKDPSEDRGIDGEYGMRIDLGEID
jgi:hypothetical protein